MGQHTIRSKKKGLEFGENEFKEIDLYCKKKILFGLLLPGTKIV